MAERRHKRFDLLSIRKKMVVINGLFPQKLPVRISCPKKNANNGNGNKDSISIFICGGYVVCQINTVQRSFSGCTISRETILPACTSISDRIGGGKPRLDHTFFQPASAATPGRVFPSISARKAPPPVDI